VKFGNLDAVCDASKDGMVRFNPTTGLMELCTDDGVEASGGSGSGSSDDGD
jgi:hypothetical protein